MSFILVRRQKINKIKVMKTKQSSKFVRDNERNWLLLGLKDLTPTPAYRSLHYLAGHCVCCSLYFWA